MAKPKKLKRIFRRKEQSVNKVGMLGRSGFIEGHSLIKDLGWVASDLRNPATRKKYWLAIRGIAGLGWLARRKFFRMYEFSRKERAKVKKAIESYRKREAKEAAKRRARIRATTGQTKKGKNN